MLDPTDDDNILYCWVQQSEYDSTKEACEDTGIPLSLALAALAEFCGLQDPPAIEEGGCGHLLVSYPISQKVRDGLRVHLENADAIIRAFSSLHHESQLLRETDREAIARISELMDATVEEDIRTILDCFCQEDSFDIPRITLDTLYVNGSAATRPCILPPDGWE